MEKVGMLGQIPMNVQRDAGAVLAAAEQVRELRARMLAYASSLSARDRGFFLPEEERLVKDLFGTYLRLRGAMLEIIGRYRTLLAMEGEPARGPFIVGLGAAGLLVSTSTELVKTYQDIEVVRQKLNEPDSAYGIETNQFEAIRDALSDPDNLEPLGRALGIYRQHRGDFLNSSQMPPALSTQLMKVADLAVTCFDNSLSSRLLGYARLEWRRLRRETRAPLGDAVYALSSWIVELVGNTWLAHQPRLPEPHLREFGKIMKPGDFFIVRPEEKVSTLFLPGWWTHAVMYCGTAAQMEATGCLNYRKRAFPKAHENQPLVLEAVAAGVVINSLEDAMHVDHAAAIQLDVSDDCRTGILAEAFRHYGKPYDFTFDFTRSDQLVCTELVYRSLNGHAGIAIPPIMRLGRPTVSADDIATMLIDNPGSPLNCTAASSNKRWLDGEAAAKLMNVRTDLTDTPSR